MIGFRICRRERAVAPDVVERFRSIPVANVSDVMHRMSAGGSRLRPMHAGRVMAGPALTVRTRPGDNLMVHKAIGIAEPGDIVVVDAGGDLTSAIIGEIMTSEAQARGLEGMVIDGAIRDSRALREADFPVYAAGITHRGPYKDGPGEINVPISVGGMVVRPGDLVLGDEDGLLCVPFEALDEVLAAASKKLASEEQALDDIRTGAPRDKGWIDATLHRLGCEFVG